MDQYLPADDRAEATLNELLRVFTDRIRNGATFKEAYVGGRLPPIIAAAIELRVNMRRQLDLAQRKEAALEIAASVLAYQICHDLNLPSHERQDDARIYYYMREDILAWIELLRPTFPHFVVIDPETITIEITHEGQVKTSQMVLSQDQIAGIAYGVAGIQVADSSITLYSSVTQNVVDIRGLVEHALIYRLPLTLATEELKRPYRVEVLEHGDSYIRLRFVNPQFMQGLLSVAHWYNLPNQGRGSLWQHLEQFTREGVIPLGF
jgi:hypothetical protein